MISKFFDRCALQRELGYVPDETIDVSTCASRTWPASSTMRTRGATLWKIVRAALKKVNTTTGKFNDSPSTATSTLQPLNQEKSLHCQFTKTISLTGRRARDQVGCREQTTSCLDFASVSLGTSPIGVTRTSSRISLNSAQASLYCSRSLLYSPRYA